MLQGMLAHATSDPTPGGRGARHVATVANVLSAACLVRTHIVGADDNAVVLGDERLLVRPRPVGQRLGFAHVRVERVGCAVANGREDDGGDRLGIAGFGFPDEHGKAYRAGSSTVTGMER